MMEFRKEFAERWNRLELADGFLLTYGNAMASTAFAGIGWAIGGKPGALIGFVVEMLILGLAMVWHLGAPRE